MSNDEPKVELYPGAEDTHRIVRTGDNAVPVDMSICRDRPQEQRRYLREQLDPRLHSHLSRLYRELGIAEEPKHQCSASYTDGRATFHCVLERDHAAGHCDHGGSWQRDPSIISTELGEFRVERMAHQHWYVYAPWQNAGQPALYAVPVSATVIPANMRQWLSDAVSRDLFARDGGTPAGVMRMLAPVFQRLGIAEEEKPDHYGVEEAEKMVARMRAKMTGTDPGEYRSTVKAEDVGPRCRAFIGATGDKCSLDVGHAGHCGHATVKTQAQEMAEAEQAMRDASNKYKAAMAAKAEKERAATRERALKAGAHSPALKTFFLGEGPQTPPVECVHPACTPEEQEHRAAYVKEKLFAKRSSKPSVGWDPYGDDGEG